MEKTTGLFIALPIVILLAAPLTNTSLVLKSPGIRAPRQIGMDSPEREYSFKQACGSEGPITICVENITQSAKYTLVTARIRNNSESAYLHGYPSKESVFLEDESHEAIELVEVSPVEFLGPGECVLLFRLAGSLSGRPARLTVHNIRRAPTDKPPFQLEKQLTIEIKLADLPIAWALTS
jgi:hypothetical protein